MRVDRQHTSHCLFWLPCYRGAVLSCQVLQVWYRPSYGGDTNVYLRNDWDKMKEGRSFASSIDRGFDSAFSSIFGANVTTMIAAVAPYTAGTAQFRASALTLGLGLLTSMFTGIFVYERSSIWFGGGLTPRCKDLSMSISNMIISTAVWLGPSCGDVWWISIVLFMSSAALVASEKVLTGAWLLLAVWLPWRFSSDQ